MEIQIWEIFAALGAPGVVLGVFYFLFRHLRTVFPQLPQVPRTWAGPIIVLYMVAIGGITVYALHLFTQGNAVRKTVVMMDSHSRDLVYNCRVTRYLCG